MSKIEIDEFHGHGGAYVVDAPGAKRRQVEKPTEDHPEGNGPRDADGTPLMGGMRKDDIEQAFATLKERLGRQPTDHEIALDVKRAAKERAKERKQAAAASSSEATKKGGSAK